MGAKILCGFFFFWVNSDSPDTLTDQSSKATQKQDSNEVLSSSGSWVCLARLSWAGRQFQGICRALWWWACGWCMCSSPPSSNMTISNDFHIPRTCECVCMCACISMYACVSYVCVCVCVSSLRQCKRMFVLCEKYGVFVILRIGKRFLYMDEPFKNSRTSSLWIILVH